MFRISYSKLKVTRVMYAQRPRPLFQNAEKQLKVLRQRAFDSGDSEGSATTRRRSHLAEYKKLGFEVHALSLKVCL